MSTELILTTLNSKEEAPWGDLKGKPTDARRLAGFLRRYGVKSRDIRMGETVVKGYVRVDLWDQWVRYLSSPPQVTATSATPATNDDEVDHQEREAIQWEADRGAG